MTDILAKELSKLNASKETCIFDGKQYIINKRYFEDPNDKLNGFLIKKYWSKKKEEWTYKKYPIKRSGIKKSGLKRTTKRKLLDKINSMNKEKIEKLYDFLINFE